MSEQEKYEHFDFVFLYNVFRQTCLLNQISYYPLPSRIFRDNLQHCVGDFVRLLVAQFTTMK